MQETIVSQNARPWRVPRFDPGPIIRESRAQLDFAISTVLNEGRFIGGFEVEQFQERACEFLGVQAAVAVGCGTDALTLALLVTKQDHSPEAKVLTNPLSFIATGSAILRAGYRPIFADVDENFALSGPSLDILEEPDIRAIVSVDLYGRPASLYELMQLAKGRPIIEDSCQAFGAFDTNGKRAGARGLLGAYSFFPSKPLGGFGDGGLLVTSDNSLAKKAYQLARHGAQTPYVSENPGFNSRLDAIQAAVLRVLIADVDKTRLERHAIAVRYDSELTRLSGLRLPQISLGHAWHAYPIRIVQNNGRNSAIAYLQQMGIEATAMYPIPLHKMKPFATDQYLPNAELFASQLLVLPIWSGMKEEQVAYTIEIMKQWHAKC